MARGRTKLAIERTFLAYVRTALAFVVVGIPGLFMFESAVIQLLGGLAEFLGMIVVVYAIFRYFQVKQYLQEPMASEDNDQDG